jgi:hypothetical protein
MMALNKTNIDMTPDTEKQLFDLACFRQRMREYREAAFAIVKAKCMDGDGKLVDIKGQHQAYRETGISTAELRTIIQAGEVEEIEYALKIIERHLTRDPGGV